MGSTGSRARSSRAKASPTTGERSAPSRCGLPSGSTRPCAGSAGSEPGLVALGFDVDVLLAVAALAVAALAVAALAGVQSRALDALRRLRLVLVRVVEVEQLLDRPR